jgi:hypothetical protein
MPLELYLLGLDIIADDNNKIKILELQSLYESNLARALELTGLDPLQRLMDAVKQKHTQLKVTHPKNGDNKQIDAFAQQASISGLKNTIPNRGIEPLCRFKSHFYALCNEYPKLKNYIPETFIGTLATLKVAFKLDKLKENPYLFKPADMTGGLGIHQLPSSLNDYNSLEQFLKNKIVTPQNMFKQHSLFMLQKYLFHGEKNKPVSKPVIRLYAAVVVNFTGGKPELTIIIDSNTAYQHKRIEQNAYDFTLINNTHSVCDISALEIDIKNFLNELFTTLAAGQQKITHKMWEKAAKEYIQKHALMQTEQRLLVLSKFALFLLQEQRFTNNKLSHYQCFLLQALLECYKERDAELYANSDFRGFLTNSMIMLIRQNLIPYVEDELYPLHTVCRDYHAINTKLGINKSIANSLEIEAPFGRCKTVPRIQPSNISSSSFFNYLTASDLTNYAAVCKTHLNHVAAYARLKN